MGRSRKAKKTRKQPAPKKLNLIGPKPVEEEVEESEESDFDPPSDPFALIDINQNVEPHGDPDEEDGEEESQEITEEEEEEEEEEEDSGDEEIQLPMKRKQVLKAAKKKKNRKIGSDEDDHSDDLAEKEAPKISYTISTFSLDELKKPVTRRKPKSRLIEISSDMEWVDVKAHLKIAICDLLFPQQAIVEDDRYEMTWCIPRVVTNPLSLHAVTDYQQLVKKALKAKEPGAKIMVDELPKFVPENEKENIIQPAQNLNAQIAPAQAAPQTKATGKAKSKVRKESDILPANVAMNEKIKQLRERWECSMTTCHSEVCFIPADGPHFALSHDLIEKWAAAILRGPEFATLNSPPNIAAFDSVSTHSVVSKSPILQARLNNMAKEKGSQGPVFNVVLPNNFGMYQDSLHAPIPQQVPPQLAPAHAISAGLIPANHTEGSKIDLATFCEIYELADSIKQRLQENAITGSHAFAHMSSTDLQVMGFKLGEVIDLKEAVKEWAQKLN